MRRPLEIQAEVASMGTVVNLTNAFRGIASMNIMRNKAKVLRSREFFEDIWRMYSQVRVDEHFRYGRTRADNYSDKTLYVLITADSGLIGDIDQRLIALAMKSYDADQHDILVVGKRGAQLLEQQKVPIIGHFKLPKKDVFAFDPLLKYIRRYTTTTVFYQSYESLTRQDIKRIDLNMVVEKMGKNARAGADIISEDTCIFEPSVESVVAYFEHSMIKLALSEVIFESRLAQDASRFRAMSDANESAVGTMSSLHSQLNRAKRTVVDQRLKEVMSGLKKARSET
jgi:F-type H+-transporting ATPase subunit gamma